MDDRDILSNVPIFASLDERSRKEVARSCTCCDYKSGEILFRQGEQDTEGRSYPWRMEHGVHAASTHANQHAQEFSNAIANPHVEAG